jgi:NitT/TauT family transport system permease protein
MIVSGELPRALGTSLVALGIAFALAAVTGIAIGFAMGWSRTVGRLLNPYVSAFYVVPIVALVPLIMIWLGFGMAARVLAIFLFCVFEIALNALGGVRSVDPNLVDVARTFGARPRDVLRRVVFPSSLPFVFVGLRNGASHAIKGMVVAEMLFAATGVGRLIDIYRDRLQTSQLLVVVVAVALLGVTVSALLQVVERRVLRWRPTLVGAAR